MSNWNPFSRNTRQAPAPTADVGAVRALTRATEGRLQKVGRVVAESTVSRNNVGKVFEKDLKANLGSAQQRFVTSNASHTQASDALKELGKAQYEMNFHKRNIAHDKTLTESYSGVLRTAQETKSLANLAQKTKTVAGATGAVSTATGVGVGVGVVSGTVALGASIADSLLSGSSATAFAKTSSLAREEADNATRTNQKGFQEEFSSYASEQAKSRATDAGKGVLSSLTGGLDVSEGVEAAASAADFALGKVGERAQSNSKDHFEKAAEFGKADLREIDNAASTIIGRAWRARKSNRNLVAFQQTVADAQQKSREEKALAKIGKNFSAARSNRALGSFQQTVADAQQKSREEKALAKIGANFSAARSNRALGAFQKAGSAAVDAANKRDQQHIQALSKQFDAESGNKTLGARFKELFGQKSTHTKLQESLHTAANAATRADRTAALRTAQEHGANWMQKHSGSRESSRGQAIASLQSGISRHIPKPQRDN